jgi:hypothetical protein
MALDRFGGGQSLMAKHSSIPQGGPKRLKSAGKTENFHGDVIAIRAYWLIHTSQKPLICALSATCS